MNENRDVLDKMVKLRFEKETIYQDEVEALFNGGDIEQSANEDIISGEVENGENKDEPKK